MINRIDLIVVILNELVKTISKKVKSIAQF